MQTVVACQSKVQTQRSPVSPELINLLSCISPATREQPTSTKIMREKNNGAGRILFRTYKWAPLAAIVGLTSPGESLGPAELCEGRLK